MEEFKNWCKENIKQCGEIKELNKEDEIVKNLLCEIKFLYDIEKISATYFTRERCSQTYTKNATLELLFNLGEREIMDIDGKIHMINKNTLINLPTGGTLRVEKNIKQNRNQKNFFIRPRNYFRIFLIIQPSQKRKQESNDVKFNNEYDDFYEDLESLY
jgi:hypothetical protein